MNSKYLEACLIKCHDSKVERESEYFISLFRKNFQYLFEIFSVRGSWYEGAICIQFSRGNSVIVNCELKAKASNKHKLNQQTDNHDCFFVKCSEVIVRLFWISQKSNDHKLQEFQIEQKKSRGVLSQQEKSLSNNDDDDFVQLVAGRRLDNSTSNYLLRTTAGRKL